MEQEVTVLFADVRGFTALSERTPLAELRRSLNALFSAASEILIAHEALVDKFLGDAIMALFNAPIPSSRHREAALDAGFALLEAVDRLGLPFAIGIGVSSGKAITGNVGGGEVTDYTAIGDTVNVASRLSGLAGPGELLAAAAACEGLGLARTAAPVELQVRGRAEPVRAYRFARGGPVAS